MMKTIARGASAAQPSSVPSTIDRDALRHVMQEASERARELDQPIIASLTTPIAPVDLRAAYTAAGDAATFYLEQPTDERGFVGMGTASVLSGNGPTAFSTVRMAWAEQMALAISAVAGALDPQLTAGPVMFGGTAFDATAPRTTTWADFPDAMLILPALVISQHASAAALTINVLVTPANAMRTADALVLTAAAWLNAIRADPPVPSVAACVGQLADDRPAAEWQALVAEAAQAIRSGHLAKVVLARGVRATMAAPIAIGGVLERLRRGFPSATIFALPRGEQTFVGATPELLASVAQGQFATMALAGSAPRGARPAEDAAIAAAMLRDPKLANEHAIVTRMLRHALAPFCAELAIEPTPHLLRLPNLHHLQTTVTGRLRAGKSALDLVAALHPTPAVGGMPRAAALAYIRADEGLDRGWYAGPVGWVTPEGDGAFGVALRSGLISGARALLYVGCGIVGASDPATEYAESRLKLRAMTRGLGLEG